MNNTVSPVLRPGSTAKDVLPIIVGRWSSRAITPDKPVDSSLLERLFEAGRWAPSAMNQQPWRFMAFGPESPEMLEKARSTLAEGNSWALTAPRLLYALTRTNRLDGKPNVRALYELGQAVAQMALQAASEGLIFHQMMGFYENKVRELFPIPDNFFICTAIAIGWPGLISLVPDARRSLETEDRVRKGIDEFVFHNGMVPEE